MDDVHEKDGQEKPARIDIAIIGMAGRFPGARDVDEFWENLAAGRESIRTLTDDELLAAGVSRRDLADPSYVKRCPVLDDIDKFDAAFFGLSPRDASVMDPAHRFFLEVAWQALEHSGNTGLPREGRVGVFAGSGAPLYWANNVKTHRDVMASMGEFLVRHTSNDMNFLATRASYDLDLRGPSLNVQTACSSALVAVHLARVSLMRRECDMAIIGGSTIVVPMGHGYHYKDGEILSPDGHCRPFDHKSAGTVFGSGTGCVVLKRLDDALDNGDTIHAVIKGSAVNNDGSVKVGFLAPGVEGQADAIVDALASAGVTADSISYVETHGTGTSVGDPIELTALEQAFSKQTKRKGFCGIGSVKSNIGHLGEAAGVASLIKVVQAFAHRKLPPTLGYEKPNPRFDLENSPFYVQAALTDWTASGPLRCGVTALGAGGTNCHVILEEPPPPLAGDEGKPRQLLVLSAKSKSALDRGAERLATFLESSPHVDFADVAYTLCMGRRSLPHRRVLVAKDAAEAVKLLRGDTPTRVGTATADAGDPTVVFTFPGGGAQYARMGFDLYASEPVYRAALDECLGVISADVDGARGLDLRPLLFATPDAAEAATRQLQRPSLALPTLFAVEYALARFFESLGVRPAAFIGHSMGEYVAACLAGVFSVRDGLRLVMARGRLFETTQKGKMVGVPLPESDVRALMPPGLSIAAVNGPELCVASGPADLVEELQRTLTAKEIDWTPIHIDVAAHSSLLDPILPAFRRVFSSIALHPPRAPLVSNLTGRWLTAAEATDPEYWVKHLRHTVRFADCVETVLEGGSRVFLEIGPGRTLTTLVAAQKTKVRNPVNSVRHPKEAANDVDYALLTLGKVWAAGAPVDWTLLYDGQLRNRVPLPTYSFDAQSYWLPPANQVAADAGELSKRENQDEWFCGVTWEAAPLAEAAAPAASFLLVVDDEPIGTALGHALSAEVPAGTPIITVRPGPALRRLDAATWHIEPTSPADWQDLFEALEKEGAAPAHVVYALGLATPEDRVPPTGQIARLRRLALRAAEGPAPKPSIERDLARSFFAPVHVAKAVGAALGACQLTFVTRGAVSIANEPANPLRALTLGPAQVIPHELPDVETRLIDLALPPADPAEMHQRMRQLARELCSGSAQTPVALRAPRRFVRKVRPMPVPAVAKPAPTFVDGDVVFITGGLGGMGLVLAQHIARAHKVKLALLSRETLPDRGRWDALLSDRETPAKLRRRIEQVRALEAHGAEVLCVDGDVTDGASLARALARVRAGFGPLRVVIHAAGVMNDEPLQTKSEESMRKVLAAKVIGTRALDTLITEELRAFVLMSSVASLLGLPGQVDYTAANAHLDAFALERERRGAGRTVVINWNAWRDVGMVVDVDKADALPPGRPHNPWLQACEAIDGGRRFYTDFSVASHWLLSEHQIKGADAVIPGTGFVELARAAFAEVDSAAPGTCIELSGVTFLSPFRVPPTRARRLQIDVQRTGDSHSVTMTTAGHADDVHMTAQVARRPWISPPALSIADVRARCPRKEVPAGGFLDQSFVDFGPRWANIAAIHYGAREALIELSLPDAFAADLSTHAYHPALMDMATGAAQPLIPGFRKDTDFYVPFGYDRIRIAAAAAARVHSHVVLRAESGDVVTFDVTLLDSDGRTLMAIDGFTMKRVGAGADITTASADDTRAARTDAALAALLREAITPAEGAAAFDRVLAQTEATQVVVSSVDVNLWRQQLDADASRLQDSESGDAGPNFSRPALSTEFVAPATPGEIELAGIWSKLLGVSQVGALDDFFELGGNSLIALRLFARVKKQFSVSLPLSTLFGAPTVRALVAALKDQGYVESAPAAAAALPAPPPSPEPLRPRVEPPAIIRAGGSKPSLFFIHDGLGEILLYRTLAMRLSPGHAVYGLAPEVKANAQFVHTRIVDMATAKVERIRSVQPHGPYFLAGLCAGGVIAFEIARQLQDTGEVVPFVGIIDAADVAADERRFRVAQERWDRFVSALKTPNARTPLEHFKGALPRALGKTANLALYEVETRLARARNARAVKTQRDLDLDVAIVPAAPAGKHDVPFLKLYEIAHKEHVPQGVFTGPGVVLFRATQGDGTAADLPFREIYSDALMGWQRRVRGPVTGVDVPGGHSSALQEPHVATLAAKLQEHVDAAIARAQPRAR